MRRLARAFAGRLCDKKHDLMSCLKCCHKEIVSLFLILVSVITKRQTPTKEQRLTAIRHFQYTAYTDVITNVDTYADLKYRGCVSILSND